MCTEHVKMSYLGGVFLVFVVVLEPVGRVGRVDEPVDVDTIVIGHERCVVKNSGQEVDGRYGGEQQKNGFKDGTLCNRPAEMVAQSQW